VPASLSTPPHRDRRLLLFTKPAREGRVKTRLIGELTPAEAATLHFAFLEDLLDRLRPGSFDLRLAWALDPGEPVPEGTFPGIPGVRQEGEGLGERLFRTLADAAAEAPAVAALGSDHPTLPLAVVHEAFERLERPENGADVVLGPAEDGGYYLIGLRAAAVVPRLFEEIAWSTDQVFPETLARCEELGLRVELLPEAADVDTPDDLRRLAARFAAAAERGDDLDCPRTRDLLASWRRITK
jgi:rSAM/selenodomain-associated transferase 1